MTDIKQTLDNVNKKKKKMRIVKKPDKVDLIDIENKEKDSDELSFRLLDYNVFDSDDMIEDKTFIIRIFGVNEKGETLCANIENFKPFFYVKIHDKWNKQVVDEWVHMILKPRMGGLYHQVSYEIVKHKKLYGFTGGNEFKFVKFEFESIIAYNRLKNLWFKYIEAEGLDDVDKGKNRPTNKKTTEKVRTRINLEYKNYEIELYESNIPPLLRYFHVNKISPTGWIKMNKKRVIMLKNEEKKSTCNFECITQLESIIPQPTKETPVPYKICSFDIEASSSHGDFPLPRKTYKRLAINIVDIFIQQRKMKIDTKAAMKILTNCILKAFSKNKYPEPIDVVYPKQMPSKEKLIDMINTITIKPIIKMMACTNPIVEQLLKTDNMFEKAAELSKVKEDTDGGILLDEPSIQNHQIEESNNNYNFFTNKKPVVKVNKDTQLLDFLLNEKYNRQENIDCLNEVLSSELPPLEGDKVTFIGSTFMNYGEKECNLQHCIVLGECGKVDNCEIDCVDTEKELLLHWTDLIQKENPDIIIGYNIFGFDYEFMFRRAQENHCASEFLQCSRIKDHVSIRDQTTTNPGFDIMNTKLRIASGEYDLRYYNMLGRLQIDMYSYFRRDYNLSSYKLDDVAGQFISDSINHIEHEYDDKGKEITKLYSNNLMGLHRGDYIHIEITNFTTDYYNNGEKFIVLNIEKDVKKDGNKYNIIVINGHHTLDQGKKLKWGMAKDDLSPQDIFRLANGTKEDKAIVAKYCIQDCNLVHHLMNKIDVITGYTEMSNICSVPINFLIFRGQGIKLTSFVAKKCMEKNTLMPDIEKPTKEEGYEGAIVLPPKCSIYMDNPVACVDYSSLYPSSMISQNYSHDSKVWSLEYDNEGKLIENRTQGVRNKKGEFIYDNLPGYEYIDIEFDTYEYILKPGSNGTKEKVKVGKKKCRWAQLPDNQLSIMPSILTELLKARKDTRKRIKTETDPFMKNILDKRQLGYKVTANSLYGQCGARTSTFYEQDVAA